METSVLTSSFNAKNLNILPFRNKNMFLPLLSFQLLRFRRIFVKCSWSLH